MLFYKSSTLTSSGVYFGRQYYHILTIGPHFMWFQKADLDELNNRLLLYGILQS